MSPLAYLAIVLALGILAQWMAWRLKIPSILLLLLFGFGLSTVTGVSIDDYVEEPTLLAIVGLFVSIILFEGGLTLKFSELREAGAPVARLCTFGALVAFLLTTVLARLLFQQDWRVAALLGAILVVTGPTVIGPLLRVIKPTRKIASILKWEGIVVDPIGAILAVLVFQVALAGEFHAAGTTLLLVLGKTILIGIVLALVLAKLIEILLRKHLIPDFLESVFLLAVVAAAFAVSNHFQSESGLLTVTVLGIGLANQKTVSVRHILEFKENLRILIISLLFILLSGRIEVAALREVLVSGSLFLAALILLVRPAAVFVSNVLSDQTTLKERFFLSGVAPRGIVAAAVTAIFALELEHAVEAGHLPAPIEKQAELLVPIVFCCIVGTVLVYGLVASPLAWAFGVASRNSTGILFAGADSFTRKFALALHRDGHTVMLVDTNYANVAAARMAGLKASRANILSEYAEEELDYSGIGQLVAATPNDEINSLAGNEFAHIFGRVNAWQIAPGDKDAHHTTAVASHWRGRICFVGRPTFGDLVHLERSGAVVKKTQITGKFSFADFRRTYGDDVVILFLHDKAKGLRPAPAELKEVSKDTSVYAFVVPDEAVQGKSGET